MTRFRPPGKIESMARALCLADGHSPDFGVKGQELWRGYVVLAKAAIRETKAFAEGRGG